MRKYLAIFKFNLKSELNFKADYVFTLIAFAVHIFVFNCLWDYILKDKMLYGYSKAGLIWYIIVGEYITYSIGKRNYIKISDMIKNGDVANLFTKPISFLKYVFSLEATSIVNVVINLIFGIILGIVLAGSISIEPLQLLLFIISVLLSLLMSICISVFIGMSAFITEENKSIYLVISKAKLLLVLTPLEFFPSTVQAILKFIPTTYAIYPPGRILVNYDLKSATYLILAQLVSLGVIFAVVYLISRKGVRSINVNGG